MQVFQIRQGQKFFKLPDFYSVFFPISYSESSGPNVFFSSGLLFRLFHYLFSQNGGANVFYVAGSDRINVFGQAGPVLYFRLLCIETGRVQDGVRDAPHKSAAHVRLNNAWRKRGTLSGI